jgi:hypothetical protein
MALLLRRTGGLLTDDVERGATYGRGDPHWWQRARSSPQSLDPG